MPFDAAALLKHRDFVRAVAGNLLDDPHLAPPVQLHSAWNTGVSDAWKLLMSVGLPDGAVRPVPRGPFDAARVREAVREVAAAPDIDVAPLLAWLRAWQHHWGSHFRATFGDEGKGIVERLRARLDDENRYLKLRRIAIENLAGML